MKRLPDVRLLIACTLSAVLLSIPWLVPHTGALALIGFIPLLLADAAADRIGIRRFFPYHFYTFILWNTLTTFWVCNATVGGGIFAIVANAAQMSLVWTLFRLARRRLPGAVPYVFLAVMWIAWEARYFEVDISWPWLVLGNAFATSTRSIQWYEYTGTLGGSLWVWLVNLGAFGLICSVADGRWHAWTKAARICSFAGVVLIHASCVALDEEGVAFIGPSGIGKSTHSGLWLKHIPGTRLLNDDQPALRLCFLPADNDGARGYWYGYESEAQVAQPVFKAKED